MKNILLSIFILTCLEGVAQDYEPQILILTPNETFVESSLLDELNRINQGLDTLSISPKEFKKYLASPDYLKQPENIRQVIKGELEYSLNLDFFKQVSSVSASYLTYRFFERFPNLLIMLSEEKSVNTEVSLSKVPNDKKLQYILNFSTVRLNKEESIPHASIDIQLFDTKSKEIILDKTYTGNWRNPGFEFACLDSTLNCTINNALSQGLNDVFRAIATNSPTLQKERQLGSDRYNKLIEDYFTGDINMPILDSAIPKSDSSINVSDCFQTLINESESKFVAFFLREVSSQNLKQLTDNKLDKNVQIITPNDVADAGFLDEIPRTYAYIVKGVKYEEKWYYEKSNVTYFQAKTVEQGEKEYFNNLQQWDFFQDGTADFNPDFWEASLFEKVQDLTKDPDWEEFKIMYSSQEYNNRPFIGLYEIVANELRKSFDDFEKNFHSNVLIPSLGDVIKSKEEFVDYYIPNEGTTAVFPPDFSIVLTPLLVTYNDGIDRIIYLIYYKDEIFQWTFPALKEFKGAKRFYRSFLVDEIEDLVDWNFSYDTLNDQDFWNNYVLLKENGNYKYLQKLK